MKRAILLGLVLLFAFLGVFGFNEYTRFAINSSSQSTETFIIDVAPGSSFPQILATLKSKNISINPLMFKIWARFQRASQKLKVGEYELDPTWPPKKMLEEIISGRPLLHKIVVKEGYSIYDIKYEFARNSVVMSDENYFDLVSQKKWLEKMGVPVAKIKAKGVKPTLEGFLFPETYAFQKYENPQTLIEEMLSQFEARALPILSQHPEGQTPEGRFKLLIMASMIEKESGVAEEQPLIASVFWNRLYKKMRFQSDPTTIYGLLPHFDGNLTRVHLTTPTPYNTYTLPSFPVTPISNPGESALKAVVNPAISNYLFFVARGDGSHEFTETYEQHKKFVQEYQVRRLKSNNRSN